MVGTSRSGGAEVLTTWWAIKMLVLSRENGYSIIIKGDQFTTFLTVRGISRWTRSIGLEIRQEYLAKGNIVDLTLGQRLQLTESIEVCLIEIREDKCRIGIVAPPDVFVSRLELMNPPYDDDGGAPAPVPRPSPPKPPALIEQLDAPKTDVD